MTYPPALPYTVAIREGHIVPPARGVHRETLLTVQRKRGNASVSIDTQPAHRQSGRIREALSLQPKGNGNDAKPRNRAGER